MRLHDSVLHLILQRYPYTLALTLAATLLGVGLAIPAGVGFDTVFNRLRKEAENAAVVPPR